MRTLVTGSRGYIGAVMVPMLIAAGHDVVGLDTDLCEQCTFGDWKLEIPTLRVDLRDVEGTVFRGFDAVIHLAALSNDPLGDLNPDCTYDINHRASVRLAQLSKKAGVRRFLFSSSCSLYGLAVGDDLLTETASFNPVTPYGESRVFGLALPQRGHRALHPTIPHPYVLDSPQGHLFRTTRVSPRRD